MRVVVAAGAMRPEPGGVPLADARGALRADEVAAALACGWREARPDDDVRELPLPDGGPGSGAALPARVVLDRHALAVTDPLGRQATVDLYELARRGGSAGQGPGRTWFLDAAGLLALPADRSVAARHVREGSSAGLGQALAQAAQVTRAGDVLVVGMGRSAVHDAGAGMLESVGGADGLAAACQGRELVLALADGTSLGGLSGAGAGLEAVAGVSAEEAADADRRACALATRLVSQCVQSRERLGAGRRSVPVSGQPRHDDVRGSGRGQGHGAGGGHVHGPAGSGSHHGGHGATTAGAGARLSVSTWGSGLGGGCALVLMAAGARALPGAVVMAQLVDVDEACRGAELVVTSAGDVFDVLDGTPVAVAGQAALARAVPAVLVAGRALVPRGELAAAGIVSVYSLEQLAAQGGSWDEAAACVVRERLAGVGARVARTWSR